MNFLAARTPDMFGGKPRRKRRIIGFRIRLSDGTCVKAHDADPTLPPSDVPVYSRVARLQ